MTPHEERHQFRTALAAVVDEYRKTLPTEAHGRLVKAIQLVLAGDVELLDDGHALVGSATEIKGAYTVSAHSCECVDYGTGRSPSGLCKHRLAVALVARTEHQRAAQAATRLACFH
jgi:hypothetical protein